MAQVEPDLLPENLPTLPEKYAAETAEERKSRMLRYVNARKQFEEMYGEYSVWMRQQVRHYQRTNIAVLEHENSVREKSMLQSLLDFMFRVFS